VLLIAAKVTVQICLFEYLLHSFVPITMVIRFRGSPGYTIVR